MVKVLYVIEKHSKGKVGKRETDRKGRSKKELKRKNRRIHDSSS